MNQNTGQLFSRLHCCAFRKEEVTENGKEGGWKRIGYERRVQTRGVPGRLSSNEELPILKTMTKEEGQEGKQMPRHKRGMDEKPYAGEGRRKEEGKERKRKRQFQRRI
jgi:hypothetical protein